MDSAAQARPTMPGTVVILIACVVGYFLSFQPLPPSEMARLVSIVWLAGIGISLLLDWRLGLRNLIRVDVFALMSLYFLLFFEFLFPQSRFDLLVADVDVVKATQIGQIGLAALVIGRHIKLSTHVLDFIGRIEMRRGDFLLIYFAAFFFSHLPMWVAVDFNLLQWWDELLTMPRFGRSWGRGRYGDISALLHELQLLGYIMPPLAGVIFARWREYGKFTLALVGLTLLLLWFGAFSSGTRNILAIQMAGFMGGFLIVQKHLRLWLVVPMVLVFGLSYVVLADWMLEFRNIGMQQFFEEGRHKSEYNEYREAYLGPASSGGNEAGYFVDYNLWRLAQMIGAFPGMYNFLGWNLPFVAATKPIPRACGQASRWTSTSALRRRSGRRGTRSPAPGSGRHGSAAAPRGSSASGC
jgi:hypothetical protein